MTVLPDLFPRQVSVTRAVALPVSADAAWAAVGALDSRIPAGDMVDRIDLQGAGEGAIRTYHLAGGAGEVFERIEHYDDSARCYVYRIVDAGPLPFLRYLGMASVSPSGDAGCHLAWHAMADSVDGNREALAAMLEANIAQALNAFSQYLVGGDGGA